MIKSPNRSKRIACVLGSTLLFLFRPKRRYCREEMPEIVWYSICRLGRLPLTIHHERFNRWILTRYIILNKRYLNDQSYTVR